MWDLLGIADAVLTRIHGSAQAAVEAFEAAIEDLGWLWSKVEGHLAEPTVEDGRDGAVVHQAMMEGAERQTIQRLIRPAHGHASGCGRHRPRSGHRRIVQLLVARVDVQEDALEMRIRAEGLASLIGELRQGDEQTTRAA